jgi:CheY-like chemotaxis protein
MAMQGSELVNQGIVMSGRTRVLVADDHRAMLDTLVRLLSHDFEVVAAVPDGLAAVTKAEDLEPDLLVLDIAMPGLNGIAAAAHLKERGSTAKVVFVTNLRDHEFMQESMALGQGSPRGRSPARDSQRPRGEDVRIPFHTSLISPDA